ncbi:MAG TPA: ATP-grasp domain-containing protein [Gemmatimonadales bacterium]|jgi:predicted ATP-grasp superfamily ATP-dependent carboligase
MGAEVLPLLIAAVTGRALAASAARAGYPVIVLDCFADRDTALVARACRPVATGDAPRLDQRLLLDAARQLAPPERSSGLIYGSGFEGRTGLLARLARGRRLFGNPPQVIEAVRDPARVFPLFERIGVPYPEVRFTRPPERAGWLVKHPGGAGGARVWRADAGSARGGAYFQRFEPGQAHSALFLADGRRAEVVGFNALWTGSRRQDRPFLYGGAIGPVPLPPAVESAVRGRLDSLVRATGLVGLNGLDFLLVGEDWKALEVNPRPTATIDLYDPDYPDGLLALHLRATQGELPARRRRSATVRGHAVVQAPVGGVFRPSFELPEWCRDIPRAGVRFRIGDPVCTVHAEARDPAAARQQVHERQRMVERLLTDAAANPAMT